MNAFVRRSGSFYKIILPLVSGIILMSPNLYWIWNDRSVWPWDMAWYGEISVDLWYGLISEPSQWLKAMMRAFSSKAPGIAWLGQFFVPLGQFAGSIEFGLLLSVVGMQLGTLTLVYKVGREFVPRRETIPLAGSVMVSSAPLFVAMSHEYLTEAMQLFAVTYVYWIAVKSSSWTPFRVIAHLLFASSLALLAKVTSPIYSVLPGCIALFNAAESFWKYPNRRLASTVGDRILFLTAIVLACGVTGWYWRNFSAVWNFAKLASSSDVALDYGKKDIFINKLQYWLTTAQENFFSSTAIAAFILFLLIVVAAIVTVKIVKNQYSWRFDKLTVVASTAIAHLAVVPVLFSLNINESSRYLLPLLPSVLIVFLWVVSLWPTKVIALTALVVFLGQWALVSSQIFGFPSKLQNGSHLVRQLSRDSQAMDEIENVVDFTCTKQTMNKYHMVGVELPWLNYNTLAFYSAKARLKNQVRCFYVYLGHAEKDLRKAWERMIYYKPVYFISLSEAAHPRPPDFLNIVSLPMLESIRKDHRFVGQKFESKANIIIFGDKDQLAALPALKLNHVKVISPLSAEMRKKYGIDYETIVVKDIDNVWLHPLPPETGQPTSVALSVESMTPLDSWDERYSIESLISIENENSEPVKFRMELWTGVDGRGDILGFVERTLQPYEGTIKIKIRPSSVKRFGSIVLSTRMAEGSRNNWSAHAKFSQIRIVDE